MKVYELMRLLGTCPAGAEVQAVKTLTLQELDELADIAKAPSICGIVTDLDTRKYADGDAEVELYLS